MAYVGNKPALNYTTFAVQHFTTSATTGYTLDHAVTNENDIRLVINNVVQQPGGSYAYTAAGTVLTLSSATAGTDTMYCVFLGKAVQTVNPGAGSVGTSQLATDAVTTVKIQDAAVTAAKTSGIPTLFLPTANPIWINGNMAVSQRATSVTGKTAGGYYTVDRMQLDISGTIGTWTIAQEAQTSGNAIDNGFANAYRIDCTSATASPAASAFLKVISSFEGQDLQMFKKGTSNAQKFTLSFWVKSNKTGTAQVNLRDMDNTRMIGASYSISVADTWEYKVCNFAADTTGKFDDDNARSLIVEWWLDGGSNYTSGAMPTAWEARNAADSMAAGSLDMAGSTSNDFAITGIQLEVGEYTSSTIPPFQHESYGDNLARCQRYYYNTNPLNLTSAAISMGAMYTTTTAYGVIPFPVSMRTAPTGDFTTGTGYFMFNRNGAGDSFDTLSANNLTPTICDVYASGSMSGTSGDGGRIRFDTTIAKIAFTAEL